MLAYNKRDYRKKNAPRQGIDKWIVSIGKHKGRIPGKRWIEIQNTLKDNIPTGKIPAVMHNGLGTAFIERINTRITELDKELSSLKDEQAFLQKDINVINDNEIQVDMLATVLSSFKDNFDRLSVE